MARFCRFCDKKIDRHTKNNRCRSCYFKQMSGENNPDWKGDSVGYRGIHKWIQAQLGKATKCMIDSTHKSTRYHWANISKEYKRDFNDWMQMCPSCNLLDTVGRRVSA